MFMPGDFYQAEADVVAIVMTQLSLKAGLKAWGHKAHDAAYNEMKQLHMRNTFKPWHWSKLSHTQHQMVLESHMFLKEKRDGKATARTVAGGNKQPCYICKEDASSPTVATESVLLTCTIDAEEGRDVAVINIPNAFVQTRAENEKDMAFIKICGVLMDILVEDRSRCLQVLRHKGQERSGTVTGSVPERTLRDNGCKFIVLPKVRQEFDGHRFRHKPVRSVRGE
jgi:hypothetical protein